MSTPARTTSRPSDAAESAPVVTVRPRRSRVLIATLLLGLLAPLFSVASPAEAAGVKARTKYERSIQNSVLKLINAQRKAHHLPRVKMNKHLQVSARRHNASMARANQMSHRVRGEAEFSRRISKAGYNWSWVGENIAWNSQMNRKGVLVLQKLMYNERAPYDGHRQNILSRHFREVGVDVYFDRKHHKVWLTTDFGHRR
ncbi:Uncharacterized conserved protein YkwD, contains CAP (CSP/antigen 5/PR1) domain [Jatrophihabitans endophyticus]|uniref:Uncharacterized conserved protein YkwD, contains CAP (CSP/antigen 5/PR1) domain n=1 Tax=Jatrophihabitans endophyticus TaxID=1206085 RepID=A0A1M5D9U8_9ACTN|nr:CAP domain-containing protein [Jatrophihabitans endophyticus]SHF63768.1 Uncharacterized conserved protein YkwD, contains CAP (CSP/antigen 5/PR1) domain [Jatrophihabitans endophyticus]